MNWRRPPLLAFRFLPSASRPGFTLVEVLVALILLSFGALAVVASSAMAIRSVSAAESELAATATARDRVETLAAGACSHWRDTTGSDSSGSTTERWTVRVARNGVRVVTDSVEYGGPAGRRAIVLHRMTTCG